MIDFNFCKNCYGCGVCSNVCPENAIEMKQDENGFIMPMIDKIKCISCGLCDKMCPALASKEAGGNGKDVFLYVNPDRETLKTSASGGAFGALAKTILDRNGYICGCVFDNNMKAEHIVSNNWSDVYRMQGSKYVQSDITQCFDKVKQLIKQNKYVLFSGTPCQCAAMKKAVQFMSEKTYLFTVAIICHGVPSPKVWKLWKESMEKRQKSPMIYANHRTKGKNYNTPQSCYEFENGTVCRMATYLEDLYCYAFSTDLFLRNSCYNCRYKGDHIDSDVIIGDFFDFQEVERYKEGVSVLILKNQKAREMFYELTYAAKPISYEAVVEKNGALVKSIPYNTKRDSFFSELDKVGVVKAVRNNISLAKFYTKKILYEAQLFEKLKKIKG